MKWWEVLEVAQGCDIKEIKRAYAKLLKINNPETNAEGYQKLREAYDIAVKTKKSKDNNIYNQGKSISTDDKKYNNKNSYKAIKIDDIEIDDKEKNINPYKNIRLEDNMGNEKENKINPYKNIRLEEKLDGDDETKINPHVNINIQENEIDTTNQVDEFCIRLNEIYNNVYKRCDLDSWKELFNMRAAWDIRTYSLIEEKVFNFLSEHMHLPKEVWNLIEINYSWTNNETDLYKRFDVNKVKQIISVINSPCKLSSDFIKNVDENLYEQFFSLKVEANQRYKMDFFSSAKEILEEALDIYSKDPDLYILYGMILIKEGSLKSALVNFNKALKVNKGDKELDIFIRQHIDNINKTLSKNKFIRFFRLKNGYLRNIFVIVTATILATVIFYFSGNNFLNGRSSIGTIQDLDAGRYHKLYDIQLNNVSEVNLYAIIQDDGSVRICDEQYLNKNNLVQKVFSKVFVGSIDGENIMFIDKKFTIQAVDKYGGHQVIGKKVSFGQTLLKLTIGNGQTIEVQPYVICGTG